jgi:general secretion pathway protein N
MKRGALVAVSPRLLALGVLLVALGGAVALELREAWLPPSLSPVAPASHPGATSPGLISGDTATDLASRRVATILARPLFNPNRRPVETASGGEPGLTRLTGVMMSAAGKTAIFAGAANGKPLVVGEGARVGRYLVGSIESDAVTVIGPGGQRVLHPVFDPNPPPAKLPAPSAAAPPTPPPARK